MYGGKKSVVLSLSGEGGQGSQTRGRRGRLHTGICALRPLKMSASFEYKIRMVKKLVPRGNKLRSSGSFDFYNEEEGGKNLALPGIS